METDSLTTQFQQTCSSWQTLLNLIITRVQSIQEENKRLVTNMKALETTQTKQAKYISSIQQKLQQLDSKQYNIIDNNNNNNTNNNTINISSIPNKNDNDALTLTQTEDDELCSTNNNNTNNNNNINKLLEVGTMAFPNMEETQIDDEQEELQHHHENNVNEQNNFYLGFGVNTEPNESQLIFDNNDNNNEIATTATQLIDQLSNQVNKTHIHNDNNNKNKCSQATQKINDLENESENQNDELLSVTYNELQSVTNNSNNSNNNNNNINDIIENTQLIENTELISDHEDLNSTHSSNNNTLINNNNNYKHLQFPQYNRKRKSMQSINEQSINMEINNNNNRPPLKKIKLNEQMDKHMNCTPHTIPETQFYSHEMDKNVNVNVNVNVKKNVIMITKQNSDKVLRYFSKKFCEIKRIKNRMDNEKLWNNNIECVKFNKMVNKFISQAKYSKNKLINENGINDKKIKKVVAQLHFVIANGEINFVKNRLVSETLNIAEKHARLGIEYDPQNCRGYEILAWIYKKNKQFYEAIIAIQQCLEVTNDTSKRMKWQNDIKKMKQMLNKNKNNGSNV